jgi:hypothetical protein
VLSSAPSSALECCSIEAQFRVGTIHPTTAVINDARSSESVSTNNDTAFVERVTADEEEVNEKNSSKRRRRRKAKAPAGSCAQSTNADEVRLT